MWAVPNQLLPRAGWRQQCQQASGVGHNHANGGAGLRAESLQDSGGAPQNEARSSKRGASGKGRAVEQVRGWLVRCIGLLGAARPPRGVRARGHGASVPPVLVRNWGGGGCRGVPAGWRAGVVCLQHPGPRASTPRLNVRGTWRGPRARTLPEHAAAAQAPCLQPPCAGRAAAAAWGRARDAARAALSSQCPKLPGPGRARPLARAARLPLQRGLPHGPQHAARRHLV